MLILEESIIQLMIFETHTLKQPLDLYLESVFHFKHFTPDHSIERVVPTGHLFLIFELDGIPRQTFDNKTLQPNRTYTKVWISGMHKNYLSISAHQDSEMFVMQFKPFGAYPFLHTPINELNNKVVDAETIFGNDILELREQLFHKASSSEKFELAEQWLLQQYQENKTPPNTLLEIIAKFTNNPLSEHNTIVETYPKTQKHLISQFKKFCGLTPKVFHRIVRFNEILQLIHTQQKIRWSQIAYQCGYTDQSHFIKEFKEFSGFNPKEFISLEFNNDEPNFFPLDRKG